jgi:hypothetical protein
MQQFRIQQEQRTCVLHDDMQQFIDEISALWPLAEVAGVASHLLEELVVFKHEVEHLDASAWEQKEVRDLKSNELVDLSLAVLRAFNSGSSLVEKGAVEYCSAALSLRIGCSMVLPKVVDRSLHSEERLSACKTVKSERYSSTEAVTFAQPLRNSYKHDLASVSAFRRREKYEMLQPGNRGMRGGLQR